MDGNPNVNSPYLPFLLGEEEKGTSEEATQSIDESAQNRDLKLKPGSFLEYPAKVSDLRLLTPYAADLRHHLGETCYVLQCRPPFSLDSVPGEWKHKASPLLWEVKLPESKGYVVDSDLGTFYFKSQEDSNQFIGKMNGSDPGPDLASLLDQRDRLRKLLG